MPALSVGVAQALGGIRGLFGRGVLFNYIFPKILEGRLTMGGILEVVEMLKSPVGVVVAIAVAGVAWWYLKWLKED